MLHAAFFSHPPRIQHDEYKGQQAAVPAAERANERVVGTALYSMA